MFIHLIAALIPFYSVTEVPEKWYFKDIIEKSTPCRSNSNCLVEPFIKVAIFSSKKREGRSIAVLLDDYFYCHANTSKLYRVPAGFETDFLSIPDGAQSLIRPTDFIEAAVIHDWLYATGEDGKRESADKIFRDILIETGATKLQQKAMFYSVRLGGEKSYGDEKEWRFYNLETMQKENPSFNKPDMASIASMSCEDEAAFQTFVSAYRTDYKYKLILNKFLEYDGFKKVN